MKVSVPDNVVTKMAIMAVLSSYPVGMGNLHHNPRLSEQDISEEIDKQVVKGHVYIDYHTGRMVKFHANKGSDGLWEFPDIISDDYQSWKSRYDNYTVLMGAAEAAL